MFKRPFTDQDSIQTRLLLAAALLACLTWLAFTFFRQPATDAGRAARSSSAPAANAAPRKLEGEQARAYLDQTSEGQSLIQALTAERFGLKWQAKSPFAGAPA